jgi:hypothetical protein
MMTDTQGNINYRQGPSAQLTKKGITKTYIYINRFGVISEKQVMYCYLLGIENPLSSHRAV